MEILACYLLCSILKYEYFDVSIPCLAMLSTDMHAIPVSIQHIDS